MISNAAGRKVSTGERQAGGIMRTKGGKETNTKTMKGVKVTDGMMRDSDMRIITMETTEGKKDGKKIGISVEEMNIAAGLKKGYCQSTLLLVKMLSHIKW